MNYEFKNKTNLKIFRPHNIYGPDMGFKHVVPQFISKLLKMKEEGKTNFISNGNLKATRAFCYVSDLIDGLMVLEKANITKEIFHIGTKDEIKIEDLIDMLASILSVEVRSKESLDQHIGGTVRRCPDIEKIASMGYSPKTIVSDGLKETCNWYLNSKESSNELL